MEPSLQIVSESKEAEEDKSWWKLVLLAILGMGASFGTFYYFNDFILKLNAASFWFFVCLFGLFLIFTILHIFFVKSFWKLFLVVFLEVFTPLMIFRGEFAGANSNDARILILGFVVGFYFVFLGVRRGYRTISNSLKMHFFEISRRMLPRVASGMLIVLSVVFYLSYFSWNLAPANAGQAIVNTFLSDFSPFSGIVVPGLKISGDENMGDIVKSLALSKVQEAKVSIVDQNQTMEVTYANLPPDYQAKVLNQVIGQLEASLKDKFGVFDSNETVSQFAYSVVSQYFVKFEDLLGIYAPVVLAAALFFIAKGTVALFYWLIELLAFLLLKILIVFGFAYTNLETRTREFMLLS